MTTFHLTVATDGAAFHDGDDWLPEDELARLLRRTADLVELGQLVDAAIPILDVNGNTVGEATLGAPA